MNLNSSVSRLFRYNRYDKSPICRLFCIVPFIPFSLSYVTLFVNAYGICLCGRKFAILQKLSQGEANLDVRAVFNKLHILTCQLYNNGWEANEGPKENPFFSRFCWSTRLSIDTYVSYFREDLLGNAKHRIATQGAK